MSSDTDDFGLLGSAVTFLLQNLPHFLRRLNSVHLRHVKICEYDLVLYTDFEGFFQVFDSFQTWHAEVDTMLNIHAYSK